MIFFKTRILNQLVLAVLGIATAAYPFAVYFGIDHYAPSTLVIVLLFIFILRFIFAQYYRDTLQWSLLFFIGVFCLIILFTNSMSILRYYPVIISLGAIVIFTHSLTSHTSMVEKFARIFDTNPSPLRKRYARNLTKAWVLLLILNAGIATYSACCLSMQMWALYNGLLSYILFGTFVVLEIIFRKHYFKKNNI